MNIVDSIKYYRVKVDKHFTVMKGMMPSREISIAITSAQNAKMWLGMSLKKLEVENPYPESKNAANTKIEPTADTWSGDVNKELNGIGHIQKVKQLRYELTALAEEMEGLKDDDMFNNMLDSILFHTLLKSWEYIIESNMWLGMELGRINKENTKKD